MILSVDLGQSGARARAGEFEFQTTRAKVASESPLEVLSDIFEEIRPELGATFETVALSLTGVYGRVPDPAPYGRLCAQAFGAQEVAVIDDGLAGYFGARGDADGVVLSVGSGVVAISARRGIYAHTDGLGHLFGDQGGGFWLGKTALERVLATEEGRDDAHSLSEYFQSEITAFNKLTSFTDDKAQSLCISAAKQLLAAADERNTDAIAIRDRGAELLARTIMAAWKGAAGSANEGIEIALLGKVTSNKGYVEAIRRKTAYHLPQIRIVEASGSNLDGAEYIVNNVRADAAPLLRWWRKS